MTRIYVAAQMRFAQLRRIAHQRTARRDGGSISTEASIWTALLAAAAIVIATIIITKITDKANSINLDSVPGQ